MRWRIGEENCGGGFNIYRGKQRVAYTTEVSPVNAASSGGEPVTSEEAKTIACAIVNAMNSEAAQ